jgi:hypothetical protein
MDFPMNRANLNALLQQCLRQAPVDVVLLIGIVLALVFWRRQSKAAALALVAFLLLLVNDLGGTVVIWFLRSRRAFPAETAFFVSVLRYGITAGAYALLIAAVFGWRKPPPVETWDVVEPWQDSSHKLS